MLKNVYKQIIIITKLKDYGSMKNKDIYLQRLQDLEHSFQMLW